MHALAFSLVVSYLVASSAADPNDWVSIEYIRQASSKPNSDVVAAGKTILSKADSTAQKGPWIIATKGIKPPSGDVRDYLSWAPYHWPDCNWCNKGSSHFANPNATDGGPDDPGDDMDEPSDGNLPENGGVDDPENDDAFMIIPVDNFKRTAFNTRHRMMRLQRRAAFLSADTDNAAFVRRQDDTAASVADPAIPVIVPVVPVVPNIPISLPTPVLPNVPLLLLPPTSTSSGKVAGTGTPAQAAKGKGSGASSCTPSPTKSLAPSATWTTCPYIVRDGKVNPDTDNLVGPDVTQDMSQSVLYNAMAYTLQKANKYSQNVAKAIDAFFLSSDTGMNPNVNFGQLVRGPGKEHQMGSFTGILDLRGMVKVVNAVQLMRIAQSPDWTSAREQAMTKWIQSYTSWLQTSDIGKDTASKANNHLTFYVNQLAAVKMYVGDVKGASAAVQKYFSNQFLDQIAQSGEQPFEAVRTRPFHYRCFNLEAMITNAKIGDQLGLNLWTAKSKYGATIQTALDYTMSVNPKGEAISDIFPHVATVAAAYGDPKGKYAAFLQKNLPDYKSQPFWFYDQSAALPHSPSGGKNKRSPSVRGVVRDFPDAVNGTDIDPTPAPIIPFECPVVFANATQVELEDGLFVTCDQLRPLYEILAAT